MKVPASSTPREVLTDVLSLELDGPQGNAWVVLGMTSAYLKASGAFDKETISKMMADARNGDYEHLLNACAEAVLEV